MLRPCLIALAFIISNVVYSINVNDLAKVDTFDFHDETVKKEIQTKEYFESILQSNNKRKIAELFNKTAVYFANNNQPARSLSYFDLAYQLFQENRNFKEANVVLNFKATVLYNMFQYEKAISVFNQSIKQRLLINDIKGIAETYEEVAFVYFNTYRLTQARRYFAQSLSFYTDIKDTAGMAEANYYIGTIYLDEQNLDSTLFFFNQSLQYDTKLKKKDDVASSYNNIGVVYFLKHDYSKALISYQRAIGVNDSGKRDLKARSIYLNNIGNVHFETGKLNQALQYYSLSLQLKSKIKDESGIAISEHNIANVYRKLKNFNKALEFFNSSIKRAERIENNDILASNFKSLSEYYEQTGDDKQAFEYYEKFVKANFSLLLDEDGRQISEFQYDNDKVRKEVTMLSHEIKMQKLFSEYETSIKNKEIRILREKKKFQRNLIYLSIGFLAFLAFVGLITLSRYRAKKKASIELAARNKNIEEQNVIIQAQSIKLEESNRELKKLSIVASETDNAVIIMDAEGNFEWVNVGFTKLFGFTYDELVTKISPNMIGPKTPQYIRDKFERCRNHFETQSYELLSSNKSGEQIWVNVTLTPILDSHGRVSKMVSIDADITGLKKAEAEILEQKKHIELQRDQLKDQTTFILEQKEEIEKQKEQLAQTLQVLQTTQKKLVESEKMAALGSLVAGVAHEINTPVGIGIAASSSMVSKTDQLEESFQNKKMTMSELQSYLESTKQACDLIFSNLNRTAELVKSFKQVSVDNMTEQKRQFNLLEYLNDIVRSLGPKLKVRPVNIEFDCAENIELNSYPGAFYQVITNFINNSLMHAFEENQPGEMKIKAFIQNYMFTLIYTDNGKGIQQENLTKVFDPFFTTNMQVGTGLGMNITYNIITQKLGGEINLESKIGEGVMFTITIPMSKLI